MSTPREASEFEMLRGTRRALSLLAGKRSVEVLYVLASGTRRYSEVLYEVGEVSRKALTQTLHALERHGPSDESSSPSRPMRWPGPWRVRCDEGGVGSVGRLVGPMVATAGLRVGVAVQVRRRRRWMDAPRSDVCERTFDTARDVSGP
jgi:hypothetical protein